jgi:hypothetical protein
MIEAVLDPGWWKRRLIELAIALTISSGVIHLGVAVSARQKELTPPNAWLAVREIYVPDFRVDEFPNLIYDREIRSNFHGYWIVEVQRQTVEGLWSTSCSGDGVNEYDPSEVIPNNTVSWSWFIGNDCSGLLEPGRHRLKVSYSMTRPGWPEKRITAFSNEFEVLAATS